MTKNISTRKKSPLYYLAWSILPVVAFVVGGYMLLQQQKEVSQRVAMANEKKGVPKEYARVVRELVGHGQNIYKQKVAPLYQNSEKIILPSFKETDACVFQGATLICGELTYAPVKQEDGSPFNGYSISQIVTRDEETGEPDVVTDIRVSDDDETMIVSTKVKAQSTQHSDAVDIRHEFVTLKTCINGQSAMGGLYQLSARRGEEILYRQDTDPYVGEEIMKILGDQAKRMRVAFIERAKKQVYGGGPRTGI